MKTVIDLLQNAVGLHPDSTAFIDRSGARLTTYAQLDELSGKIAAEIVKRGYKKGSVIPVMAERCMEYFAAEIGILKAGCVFVPLITEYPKDRVDYIMRLCESDLLIDLDFIKNAMKNQPLQNAVDVNPDDGAYIIFTSGSTGQPKGIYHTHKSFCAYVTAYTEVLGLNRDDLFLDTVTHSFILSLLNYTVLLSGAAIHMLGDSERKDIHFVEDYILNNKITFAVIAPSQQKVFKNKSDSLKRVFSAGEKLSNRYSSDYLIINSYGSSEIGGALYFNVDKEYENTPIGKPVNGITAYILDKNNNPVPDGTEGELCISGASLARGYIKLEEQTEKLFVSNPFSTCDDDKIMFRTGDVVKRLPDGNIVYLNRSDWMVKINGQRVDPGEIEDRMKHIDSVDNAAVKCFAYEGGANYLCGYYSSQKELNSDDIRQTLSKSLPPYMLPAYIIRLEEMPLNANGKIDRTKLFAPDVSSYKASYEAPQTEMQKMLCEAFETVLNCGRTGIDDDFFLLGGDSIKAMELQNVCGISGISTAAIFDGKTPRKIAEFADTVKSDLYTECQGERRAAYPLTPSQVGVYFACIENPLGTMYNTPASYSISKNSDIDIDRLIYAIKTAVNNHAALNCSIESVQGAPCMIPHDDCEFDIPITRVSNSELESARLAFVKPFDIENDRLFRFEIFETQSEYCLAMDFHHLVFDGTSLAVLCREISLAYDGKALEPEQLTLLDLSVYEKKVVNTEKYSRAQKYFESVFADIDVKSELIADFSEDNSSLDKPVGHVGVFSGDELSSHSVETFAHKHKITPNTLFLAAYEYTVAKFSGSSEVLVCTVNHGRHDSRMKNTVGMMVRTLPLYAKIDEKMSVPDFLLSVHENFQNAVKNDVYPFVKLSDSCGVSADIMLAYQSDAFNSFTVGSQTLALNQIPVTDALAKLNIMIFKANSGFEINFEYRADLYKKETVRSFADSFVKTIKELMQKQALCEINILSDDGKKQLDSFNDTECDYDSSKSIVDLFREQAVKTPQNTAVVYLDKSYTYNEVDELSERVAAYLNQKGIGSGDVVSVLIPRCEYMVIASIGVLKSGAAYQPLDPSYPMDRLEFMMNDASAKLLITDADMLSLVPNYNGETLFISDIPELEDRGRVSAVPKPDDLFILLYTSGSTGVPKGCMLEHKNLAAFCSWYKKYYGLTDESRVAAYASYGFDADMMDLYPALTSGAAVYIIDEEIRLDLLAIKQYFADNKITHSFMTTQVGRQFASVADGTLKYLSVGGERLVPIEPPKDITFCNGYGPTECTIFTTVFKVDKYYDRVPIGYPLDNIKLYVVDKQNRRLPVGAPGELCVSGVQVARGYLNRPDKTAETFVKNPFSSQKGYERMYRTGDIVRIMPDGAIDFIGRNDAQVKIRGFRIELSEVEEVIRRFEGIKDATVAAFDDASGGKYIAAYVVSENEVDISALNSFIAAEKPPYMVPAVIMQIDKIPLNQNHKVNKRALPKPEKKAEKVTPPQNEVQQKISDIIAEVIGSKAFGIDTDIFEAGLTSIGSIKLNVVLSEQFGKVIKINDLKENNTVLKLEGFLANAPDGEASDDYDILSDYPITKTQEGIFVECMANPGTTIYNVPYTVKLGDGVDVNRLKTAVEQTVNAHPYLKTTLEFNGDGVIRAQRNDDILPQVSVINADLLPSPQDLVKPFDIVGGRLYNAEIYVAPTGNYLYFDCHHIVNDGTSLMILLSDIDKAYGSKALQKETYTGYELALDEEKARQGKPYKTAQKYYRSIFDGCEPECLPNTDKSGEKQTSATLKKSISLSAETVKNYCEESGVTLNGFFNAVFGFVLSRYCGREDAVYTTIYNGRSDSRTVNTVTMMVKTLPVYCNAAGETKVSQLVKDMQSQIMNSMSNDIYSFAEISNEFGIKADVMFVYQGDSFERTELCGEACEKLSVRLNAAKAPISFDLFKNGDSFTAECEYRSDMFGDKTINELILSFERAAQEFLSKQQIKQISMLSENSVSLISQFNATDVEVERTTCNKLFEEQVSLNPDKIAVIADKKSLTYSELNEAANRIAHSLIDSGSAVDEKIAVMMPRTVYAYAAREGVMKAGGAFVPLDPEYPDDRISYILESAQSARLVTTREIAALRKALLENSGVTVMTVEDMLNHQNVENPETGVEPSNLAYCIFTSGSTGKPKGVMIEHHSLANFVHYDKINQQAQEYCENMSVSLAFAALTFDVSVLEETLPLYHGATVAMATEDEIHNPILLAKMLAENKVDVMKCTPSYMNNLLEFEDVCAALKNMKAIDIGAEPFPAPLYGKMRKAGITAKIYNGYGPTEATITTSIDLVESSKITIGKPLCNTKLYMLDKYDNILPVGVPGEMLICGSCVGRGYVGNEKLTNEKFITFNGMPAYRSGDLARWSFDGKVEIFGRMDNQIKLHGLRIELDEIENVMNTYPSVTRSVVIVRENEAGDTYLCGYFTASEKVDNDDLINHLKKSLTHYMIPAALVQLPKIPLNQNGKVDKKALPKPDITAEREYVEPRTPEEKQICDAFADVLKLDRVGATDNFFDLGGTSLIVITLIVKLKNRGIEAAYGDIFKYKTPEEIAKNLKIKSSSSEYDKIIADYDYEKIDAVLSHNTLNNLRDKPQYELGNLLVTGATGYLGIHVVYEFLQNYDGCVYCLVRGKKDISAEQRMRLMLYYYFENSFDELFGKRIFVVDGDVTGNSWFESLKDAELNTVINCAALVKHFSDTTDIEDINIGGVKNLIEFCEHRNCRLVQVSTVSVSGYRCNGYPDVKELTEQMLYIKQSINNKYVYSKIIAERCLLEAAAEYGLDMKIMRVGNLSPRDKDGEFQINFSTNSFMNRLKAYVMIGAFPYSQMNLVTEMSAINTTALSVLKLSQTPRECRVFHPYTNHMTPLGDIILKMKDMGFDIDLVEDDEFEKRFEQTRNDAQKSKYLAVMMAYSNSSQDKIEDIPYANEFTCQALYRKGCSWQPNSMDYIGRFIDALRGLGFFDEQNQQ